MRVTVLHKNVAHMIAKASSYVANDGINISNLVSASRGEIGYMIMDLDGILSDKTLQEMRAQDGFMAVKAFR